MAISHASFVQAALTTSVPTNRERWIAIGVIASSIAAFVLMAPFAQLPLVRLDSFIPSYESASAICDLMTAVLLFGQFSRTGARAVLVLGAGYLFDVFIIIPHALTFPGVFAPQGLLGAGPQTTAWLYCFWHGGFALFVMAYAIIAGVVRNAPMHSGPGFAIAAAALGAAILAVALTGLATVGQYSLPPIMRGADFSLLITSGISPVICLISIMALLLLWRRCRISELDLWLFVVMSAWLCDVMLSAVVASSRFDLGWYGGRSYGLLAASFLLVTLLGELNHLHRRLAGSLADAETRNIELAKAREDLAHAQRLDAMGQLTGGVAHDFNNLLMVVIGSMDLMLRSPGNTAKVEKLARGVLEASGRGQKLTQQLLTFARKQVIEPVTVDPNRLLADLVPLLQRTVGATIDIETLLSPGIDAADIDPAQFETAILNLVINARDASNPAGRVTIETANAAIPASNTSSGAPPATMSWFRSPTKAAACRAR
jgi:signal transduction histidine kinase